MDHFDEGFEASPTTYIQSLASSIFSVVRDFFGGGSTQSEASPARKAVVFGFSFFLLVTAASYTASLASILVAQKQASGQIESMEDAVKQGVTVCAPGVVIPTLKTLFPKAVFEEVGWMEDAPRKIYSDVCGAAVMSAGVIAQLSA